MRPSTRLMVLAIGAFAVSMLAIAVDRMPDATGLYLFGALGLFVVADIFISRARGSWAVDFDGPTELFINENSDFSLRLSAESALPRDMRARVDWPRGLEGPEEVYLEPQEEGLGTNLNVRATERGRWPIERLWLSWASQLGLISFCPRLGVDARIDAVPNVRPVQSGEIDVKVQSTLFGVKENFLKGEGSEFHQLRDWVQGMDPRTIDWKQSARHRALVAKEMRAERNHHVILALDNGFLMRERLGGVPKIDHAVNAALAVAWAAGQGGDLVGLYAFDSQPRMYLPPEPGRAAFPRLRTRMAELEYASVETNHTLGMARLHQRLKRRSLVVVFSDFVDTTTAELLVENITVLNKAHVIVFVALRDPELEAIANGNPDGMTDVARAVSAAEMLRERRVVMERLQRLGVFVVDALPDAVTARLISTYLTIKSREII
ncbi:MAG: DUF58 domain-containing protein [Pseudomonadota bacterium]